MQGCCSFAGGLDGSRRGNRWHICSPWQRGGFLPAVAAVIVLWLCFVLQNHVVLCLLQGMSQVIKNIARVLTLCGR